MRRILSTQCWYSRCAAHAGIVVLLLSLLLAGCNSRTDAGISGSGAPALTLSGTLTSTDNLSVNGKPLESQPAQIEINGNDGSREDLETGQVVTVTTQDPVDASPPTTVIRYDSLLIGNIGWLSTDTFGASDNSENYGEMWILGRAVVVTPETLIDPNLDTTPTVPESLTLALDTTVEVSGYSRQDGKLEATLIKLNTRVDGQIVGHVTAIEAALGRLWVDGQQINLDAARIPASLETGDRVRLLTSLTLDENGTVNALEITRLEPPARGSLVEMSGIIQTLSEDPVRNLTRLQIDQQQAIITSQTIVEIDPSVPLAPGLRVAATGIVNAEGLLELRTLRTELVADQVSFQVISAVTFDVAAPAIAKISFADGTEVYALAETRIADYSPEQAPGLNLETLAAGDGVRVASAPNPLDDSIRLALVVERRTIP